MTRLRKASTLRILDFDIETRKVGFHIGGRFNPDGCEPIALAASWVGSREIRAWVVGDDGCELQDLLDGFVRLFDEADLVTGHYIRRFDLKVLNGALLEAGRAPLGEKLTSDTKTDLVSFAGLSASQENLAKLYRLVDQKFHMADADWRDGTRLTPTGIARTRRRVTSDVRQHKRLRAELLEHGWLREPRRWP